MRKGEREKAAALKYDASEQEAPVLVAKGQGDIARKIKELAREHEVPLYQDATLVEALMSLEINTQIPMELYKAVAEVLAFIYRMDQSKRK